MYGLEEGEHIRSYARKHWQRKAKAGSMILWSGAMFLNLSEEMSEDPYYFMLLPEAEMPSYRNIHLGSWEKDKKGLEISLSGKLSYLLGLDQ